MAQSTIIRVEGLDQLVRKVNKTGDADYVRTILTLAAEKTVEEQQQHVPPPVPTYERTGVLSRSYYAKYIGANTLAGGGTTPKAASEAGNTAVYSKYVVGDEQTRRHAEHLWPVLVKTAEALIPWLNNEIHRALLRIWR